MTGAGRITRNVIGNSAQLRTLQSTRFINGPTAPYLRHNHLRYGGGEEENEEVIILAPSPPSRPCIDTDGCVETLADNESSPGSALREALLVLLVSAHARRIARLHAGSVRYL